jgi:hypothetical protein
MIREIRAVSLLIYRWFGVGYDFFVRWFLPPPFPPDPEEDEPGNNTIQTERHRRLGWVDGPPEADDPDYAGADQPLYPTAPGGSSRLDGDSEDPDYSPQRPSQKGGFLSDDGGDWRDLIRPPEGQIVARGASDPETEPPIIPDSGSAVQPQAAPTNSDEGTPRDGAV